MKRIALIFCALAIACLSSMADAIDDLQAKLKASTQVQEKIYVHTDNSCYFVGDTLWYKAYVTHATDMKPTRLSKLLYVELLTPDGYLVERQHVEIDDNGGARGQFILYDSLYSGYYEIRAYTRWQLNFNAVKKSYTRDMKLTFYPSSAAADFFRKFEGLYSRVLPVYEKPKKTGDFTDRYMANRPKQRILKNKDGLLMHFYPEGGQMVNGLPCRVAYELTDRNGQAMDLEGQLSNGQKLKPQHLGRGVIDFTPDGNACKATFTWNGKTYDFSMPKALDAGATLALDIEKGTATVKTKGIQAAAYAVTCRGKLMKFERMNGNGEIKNLKDGCRTGINELIIYDAEANPVASRLFFVNNHDYGTELSVNLKMGNETVGSKTTLPAYAPVNLDVTAADGPSMSLAVRDAQTDDRGYDNGNMMTEMLLSSELKGFIATPGYYFAADDEQHRADLDLLMMVQGWRRYKTIEKLKYMPERELAYEGTVYTVPSNAGMMEADDIKNAGKRAETVFDTMLSDTGVSSIDTSTETETTDGANDTSISTETTSTSDNSTSSSSTSDATESNTSNNTLSAGHKKKDVYVEAEIVKGTDVAGAITTTNKQGHFKINLPKFYDKAYLFVKAYDKSDSLKKCMTSTKQEKDRLNERAFPDYYVKRDMFFPIYSEPYSWYQINSPELDFIDEEDDGTIPATSRLAGNHMLQTVIVKAKRRGKRGINMNKPAIVRDAYDMYNDATDWGLMRGVADFNLMPEAFTTLLVGNMGRTYNVNVRAMLDGTSFYRNYTPMESEYDRPAAYTYVFERLRLSRIKNIRAFTDYELRTDSGDVSERNSPDVTLDFQLIPDDGVRVSYRDRRYVLDGLAYAEDFYSPDYSGAQPAAPTDYRRTLYWNPDVKADEKGHFTTTFYNNCRETRVTVSAAGIDSQGQIYYK